MQALDTLSVASLLQTQANNDILFQNYETITPPEQTNIWGNGTQNSKTVFDQSIKTLKELERLEAKNEWTDHKFKCYCCYDFNPISNAQPHAQVINDIYREIDFSTQNMLNPLFLLL